MNTNVLRAVFTRNFVSYFASPTGYVFICVFVLLSSFATFWPHEFFNSNLANLDQLNKVFPFIMLIFIPAITMSVWADERRQGTDELLLTIPAGDLDIVLGKYLAAVAIYSVSLLFSLVCNFAVLRILGHPDVGLFLGTYVGYWLVGVAMLAVGMVASFLTANLTVGFILGAVFNAPLVFAVMADAIFPPELARAIKPWSISEQFRDFGRGVISLSGIAYFLMVLVAMLYLSMVLIGRRHWARGRDWHLMACHFLVRTLAVGAVAVGAITLFGRFDLRYDATSEKLSSLSSETTKLLDDLDIERPVQVEAFVSPVVPETYVQARLNLLTMLQELQARGGSEVQVRIHETERFSEEAARAEQRFGIEPRRVVTMRRGTLSEDYIFMGVAFTCGLEKVALPFVDRGIPAEYELVRSICTVTQQQRKKIGILQTDAQLYGQFNMQSMSSSPNWPIIDELEKMYEVVRVDPSSPITERYDALLAVQPSSLGEQEMTNFIAAVRAGQPTAIFEDPFPGFAANVPATTAPRRPPGGTNPMMMRQQPPPPKGNIGELWRLLGIDFAADLITWQDYNPYPRLGHLPSELVFVDDSTKSEGALNDTDPITSGLQLLLFPFPGSVSKQHASQLEFEPLVRSGDRAGTVRYGEMIQMGMFGQPGGLNPRRRKDLTNTSYVLAAAIHGPAPTDPAAPADDDAEKEEPKAAQLNVVVVTDIDMLHREFFMLREQGANPEVGVDFNFDNVTFVLNLLDTLADDPRFVEVRKRRPKHRTLSRLDDFIEDARSKTTRQRDELQADFEVAQREEQEQMDKMKDQLQKRMAEEKLDIQEIGRRVSMWLGRAQQRMQTKIDQLEDRREREIKKIETDLSLAIRKMQDRYKMWAVLLPPIPPLFVAVAVFLTRRAREREGVSRSRLR